MTLKHRDATASKRPASEWSAELARLSKIEERARKLYRFIREASGGEAPTLLLDVDGDETGDRLAANLNGLGDALGEPGETRH